MKLQSTPFHAIRDGSKTIEVRLNDEKRKLIREGDEIVFALHDDLMQELRCVVLERLEYKRFSELFDAFPLEMFGGNNKENLIAAYYQYYTPEDERRLGVLGLRIQCI